MGGQVSSESALNDAVGSVCSADLAPGDTELVAGLVSLFGLGDEGNLLSHVPLSIGGVVNVLDLDQRHILVLVAKTAAVTKDGAINVKLWWTGRHVGIGN